MATHGSIGEFNPEKESWTSYTERLEEYFLANDVESAEKQRAVLLSVCGAATYQKIRDLLAPVKPKTKSFSEIVEVVKNHHQPPPSFIVQRFNFNMTYQKEGESISDFIANLRRIAEHCNYGTNLEDMLRDRIVCGVRDKRIQQRLLTEPELKFKEAREIALATETAARSAQELQAGQTPNTPSGESLLFTQDNRTERRRQNTERPGSSVQCYRCGGNHHQSNCRFREAECHACKKKGHIARVCRSKSNTKKALKVSEDQCQSSETSDEEILAVFSTATSKSASEPMSVIVQVNQRELTMEVDTGASVSLISEATYKQLWQDNCPKLNRTTVKLRTYSGEMLVVLGSITVDINYRSQEAQLPLLVVAGNGPSLLGKNWLQKIRLNWTELLHKVENEESALEEILLKHSEVFKEGLGLVKGYSAQIHVDPKSPPKFHKARPVAYSLRERVNDDLDRLQREGIIEPVEFSEWAAPIVPVVKANGSIRICGDYKTTVNAASKLDKYPLPRIDDLFSQLEGGKMFSKLDLSSAFQQIPLDEESKKFTTINTSKGLFQYTRLPFGISSAPSIFQRFMDSVLSGLHGVASYIDDIVVTGKTHQEHLQNLDSVLTRLERAGLRLNRTKSTFMLPNIQYLGHVISAEGIKPSQGKVSALLEAPAPTDVQQLRSFLGAVNYYRRFIPNLSTTLAPLNQLLQKGRKWSWRKEQDLAFTEAKKHLTSTQVLTHYDPQKPLVLSCDASPYGVGAVISHQLEDGAEKPIAFASRTLSPAEKKYAQLDKEALSIIFGVKRFQQYLQGRQFTIMSDHKPLEYLLGENKPVPVLASARIKRWALILSAHDYKIQFRPGQQHGNADVLSRLPLPITVKEPSPTGAAVLLMETLHSTPVDSNQIRRWTDRDPVLSKVRRLVQSGWEESDDENLKPYQIRSHELSVQDSCVLWGDRVIIPKAGIEKTLQVLHDGHPGISKMKQLARSVVWWPGIDSDIEKMVKSCQMCSLHQKSPPVAPLHPWEWPRKPWTRIHIDHAGPFMGKMFLIIIDSFSKWLEVVPVSSADTLQTVTVLRQVFSTHGIPEMIVSDNGAAFTSSEFEEFTKRNGIRHLTTTPYHPSTNGLAERAVQVFKQAMRKAQSGDLKTKLARFLLHYRTTPHATTGTTPAELLMGRPLRTLLDLMRPNIGAKVESKQLSQKLHHDNKARERTFVPQDNVYVRKAGQKSPWIPGTIVMRNGNVHYEVKLDDQRTVRRHIDHIKSRTTNHTEVPPPQQDEVTDTVDVPHSHDLTPTSSKPEEPSSQPEEPTSSEVVNTDQPLRRSTRVSRPPPRYGDLVSS